jgi:hypothetical protein
MSVNRQSAGATRRDPGGPLVRATATCLLLGLLSQPLVGQSSAYTPKFELPTRTQVLAICFGQSDCAPCREPALKAALHDMKPLLLEQANRSARDFSTLGVALDWDLEAGLSLLEPLTELDEVAVGANWMNAAAIRWIWQDSTSRAGIPQIVLVERTVAVGGTGIAVGPDRLLKRVIGADAIRAWVAQGAPLPPSR